MNNKKIPIEICNDKIHEIKAELDLGNKEQAGKLKDELFWWFIDQVFQNPLEAKETSIIAAAISKHLRNVDFG